MVITGLGFTEVLTILVLVLLFFGSKELPHFIREAGRLFGRLRQYGDQVRRELNEVSQSVDPKQALEDSTADRKAKLRETFIAARTGLTSEQRAEYSTTITHELMKLDEVRKARAVMVYLHTAEEVQTDMLVTYLRAAEKRTIVPYCRTASRDLGIAEVTNLGAQTTQGQYGIREPIPDVRDNFLKSDIQLVVCPGVAFDKLGGRLGRGKGYYDNFLREISGRVPIIGLAYSCQISDEPFPFDYHDVPVTQVITEKGPLIERE
ncbi:MAG: 5-formyltetrahydrofolate cyclo-ligase [Chitinivibrionales bacterium]|nr:5-formyltetrahydrofolate cyclo-ligase [Chitinivibrionales bacterium]